MKQNGPASRLQKRNTNPRLVKKYKTTSLQEDVGDWYQSLNQQLYQTQRIIESTEQVGHSGDVILYVNAQIFVFLFFQMRQNAKQLIEEKNAKARKAKLLAEKELDFRIDAEKRQLSKLKVIIELIIGIEHIYKIFYQLMLTNRER